MGGDQLLLPKVPKGDPSFGGANPAHQVGRKTKASRACDTCRSQRKKCNGENPCTSCYQQEIECSYSGADRRKKEALKSQIQALEDRNAYLEHLVEQLSRNSSDKAIQNSLQQSVQQSPQDDGSTQHMGSSHPSSVTDGNTQMPDEETSELRHMLHAATSHPLVRSPEAQWQQGRQHGYRGGKLPDENITRLALDAFFECAATSFYVTTEKQAARLMEKVYHSYHASPEDTCELCALATIGSHYLGPEIPDDAREAYFYLASTSLDETLQAGTMQGMRIFICLWMSSIMDTSYSAKLLIISALNLARGKLEADSEKAMWVQNQNDEYQRTLQTLVHYTVPLELGSVGSDVLTTRLVQTQMTKLALIACKTRDELPLDNQDYWTGAEKLLSRLDIWHRELPANLHIAAISNTQVSVGVLQEKSLYIMHMLYMDTRIQLYGQLLKASCDSDLAPTPDRLKTLLSEVPQHVAKFHAEFAVQIVRTASLLYERSAISTRCWLVVRAVFDACVVLLLNDCIRLIVGAENSDNIADIFTHINGSLTVLDFCSRSDIAASRLRDMLEPVIKGLSRLGLTSALSQGDCSNSEIMEIQHIIDHKPEQNMELARMIERLLSFISPTKNIWI
ncbi:uncharacterized protein DSM5745_08700 [Aspergillus mulundensis]|uniref:Zn(2)-C6 fungal-type domain-containing protein n=1 Tax=Aspergillus mulundensis TaxID=1810919 RepID=A0A3D8R4P2_9EURO|nr:hypothetical protein DSM5745_08700 [Aspergillus mulundensis]RDW68940.1 hypothetical protein DSM5745_08700 [Aspergillus mulundensis]